MKYRNALLLPAFLLTIFAAQAQQELPFDPAQFKPMPLPKFSPPKDTANHELKAIYHNLLTGKTDTFEMPGLQLDDVLPTQKVRGYNPHDIDTSQNGGTGGSQNYYFTNLIPTDQISGFPNYPFSTIVKLYLTFQNPNGSTTSSTCSGAMISRRYAITAGHCVADPQTGAYLIASPQSVAVPAYNMGNIPFGYANIVGWWSFSQWFQNGNYDYDIALVELGSNIGDLVGWLGFAYQLDNYWFLNPANDFKSLGYPGSDDFGNPVFEGGERMYAMNGFFDWVKPGYNNVLCHNNLGFHGQSGSGFYFIDNLGGRYVFGALSHGNGTTPPYNTCHCKMDAFVFNSFLSKVTNVELPETEKRKILVYPNPTNGPVSLDLPTDLAGQKTNVSVTDAFGKMVFSQTFENKSQVFIDLSHAPAGVYWLVMSTTGETVSTKILKN